jgi:hypothetical protein
VLHCTTCVLYQTVVACDIAVATKLSNQFAIFYSSKRPVALFKNRGIF